MSDYSRTNLTCTRPEIIASGCTFVQASDSELIGNKGNEMHFTTHGDNMHEELLKLSIEHPGESFSARTWNDSDYYYRIIYTVTYKNGHYQEINSEPGYVFCGPSLDSVDDSLSEEFQQKILCFLKEINPPKLFSQGSEEEEFPKGQYLKDGLRAYITFERETEDHRFIAENKHGYMIEIKYQSKDKENLKRLRLDNEILRKQLNESDDYDNFPF